MRDEKVNELAEQARRILKVPTKTEAIRQALERVVETEKKSSLEERIKPIQDRIKALCTPDPDFDEKAFLDDMWGN